MIRVGIIGAHIGGVRSAGSWGVRAHIPALAALPMFEVSAVATSNMETARETADRFGIAHAFADPDELARHPDVDVVAVCVRVPEHARLVSAAVAAGKHVYCEWPLGRTTAEAIELRDMADRAGVRHIIGLQGRQAPAIRYLRDLLRDGAIGTFRGCTLNHSVPWPTSVAPSTAYLQTRESGANYYTIPGAHTIDTVTDLLGGFVRLTAMNQIQVPQIAVRDSDEVMVRDTPDLVTIVGELEGGGSAVLRFQGGSATGAGIRLEINGSKGDLLVAPISPEASMMQIWDLGISRATSLGRFEEMPIPEHYFTAPPEIRTGPPLNVAQTYLELAAAIAEDRSASPNFDDAVRLHRLLDTIQSASDQRRWLDA